MSLRDRLLRLERAAVPSSPRPSDDLRRRLDRVHGVRSIPLPGRRVRFPAGETRVCETVFRPDELHGRLPLRELGNLPHPAASELFPQHLGAVGGAENVVFLDTETTGLAGGAGTVPFLIGIARWTSDGFRISQYFLEDLDREPAQLDALEEGLAGTQCLVTYNGRSYDIPLLENRHVLNRRCWPLARVPHLDLLYPARTLWKRTHRNCRLVTLEEGVLGYARQGDVPGAEIPGIYSRFLARGADPDLLAVFEHNRLDLLSLAGLLWAATETAGTPSGAAGVGVGRLHARRGCGEAARLALESSLCGPALPPDLRARALRDLARFCKAAGAWERALEVWAELRRLVPGGDPWPVLETAKALERKFGDRKGALAVLEEALGAGVWSARDRADLEARRQRLLSRRTPGAQPLAKEGVP